MTGSGKSDHYEKLLAKAEASASADVPPFRQWLPEVTPSWVWDWPYLVYIQDVLDRVTTGDLRQVMLFMPPRHGKSEMTTVRYPMWRLQRDPSLRIIVGAYNATLAKKFSRKCRKIARAVGVPLSRERTAVDDWETETGGGLRAVGVGGGVTGMGAQLILIDDPVKSRAEAQSETYRDAVYEWYTDDLFTRQEPGCAIILIMTRWHEDDLAGRILASEDGPNWTVISLPAIAEEGDELGRSPGEALCPERYDVAALERLRRVLRGSFDALFQQRPHPASGDLFKDEWFANRYKHLPEMTEVWTCWDTALKDGEQNDETAGVTAGLGVDGHVYLLRAVHGRWETPDVAKFLVAQAQWLKGLYGDRYRGDYVEDKVSGTTLMQFVRRSHPDVALIPIQVEGDKVARANGVTPTCEAGQVRFPDPSTYVETRGWAQDLLAQLMKFPSGKHDDLVDAFVYMLKRFLGTLGRKKSRRGKGGGTT